MHWSCPSCIHFCKGNVSKKGCDGCTFSSPITIIRGVQVNLSTRLFFNNALLYNGWLILLTTIIFKRFSGIFNCFPRSFHLAAYLGIKDLHKSDSSIILATKVKPRVHSIRESILLWHGLSEMNT